MRLIDRRRAFWQAHWPEVGESLANLQAARTPAHIRLIFEELFFLELGLEVKRRKMRAQTGIAFPINDSVRAAIKRILPFHPTAAQKRVLKEIAADMAEPLLCGGCCKATSALAKRSSRSKLRSSPSRTATRSR